jgi:Flp pilus assembly pilin Flp
MGSGQTVFPLLSKCYEEQGGLMRLLKDRRGLETVEYIAVGALVVALTLGALYLIFTRVGVKLQQINAGL